MHDVLLIPSGSQPPCGDSNNVLEMKKLCDDFCKQLVDPLSTWYDFIMEVRSTQCLMLAHFMVIDDSQPEVAEDEPEQVEIDEPRQQSSDGDGSQDNDNNDDD